MKQLYSAKNGLEAHDLRLFLEAHGIEARVFGDNNALESVFSFTPASAPGVWVDEADLPQAASLLEKFRDLPVVAQQNSQWTCPHCGVDVEEHFEVCWQCEAVLADAVTKSYSADTSAGSDVKYAPNRTEENLAVEVSIPLAPIHEASIQANHNLWLAVATVLAIAWFPYFAFCFFPDTSSNWSFAAEHLWQVINQFPIIAVVLYVIYRDGRPWKTFGITQPRWFLDPAAAFAILVGANLSMFMLYMVAADLFGAIELEQMSDSTYEFAVATTRLDLAVLVLFSLSTGLSEELVMRGYLIPTFEHLLKSTPKSILITAMLFASYHLYQGMGSAVWIFVLGIIFGGVFCLTRHLWPLALAHAAMDVIALWPSE